MVAMKATDDQIVQAIKETGGNLAAASRLVGLDYRQFLHRRENIERDTGIDLVGDIRPYNYNPRLHIDQFTGSIVIFSDCHWWPGLSDTPAYLALLEVIRDIKPALIVANGDIMDGATISKHGPLGWERKPDLKFELEEVKGRMEEIQRAHKKARLVRTIGNHDQRFDKRLADKAYQYEGIAGFRLADHLPAWQETMALWVNNEIVIKHRWHGGISAGRNNVMKSGKTMVTGHDHILWTTPYSDYNGIRFAVQDGTLSEPGGPQFSYAEDNPSQANSGFVVLTIDRTGLHEPELCRVRMGDAYFRSQRVVSKRKVAA